MTVCGKSPWRLPSRIIGLAALAAGALPAESSPGGYHDWVDQFPGLTLEERVALANPSGDGVPNVFKFAFDLDPRVSGRGQLPRPVVERNRHGDFLVLEAPLREAAVQGGALGWATTWLRETWAGGVRNVQNTPETAAWYSGRASATVAVEPGRLSQSLSGGSALLTAYFTEPGETVSIAPGETLRVRFGLSFTGTEGVEDPNFVRFGLFDTSMNHRLAADGQGNSNSTFSGVVGYGCMIGNFGEGGSVGLRVRPGASSNALLNVIGVWESMTAGGGASFSSALREGIVYEATLAVTRASGNMMQISTSLRGPEGELFSASATEEANLFTEFDTFAIISSGVNGEAFHLHAATVDLGPADGLGILAEWSSDLGGGLWRGVNPRHLERDSAALGRVRLPMEGEPVFLRFRATRLDRIERTRFADRTEALGLPVVGGAVCWVDFNNNGFPDLVAGGRLFRNNQGNGFTQIASGLGWVVAGDSNNNGWPDLFSFTQQKLYRNNHGNGVVEVPLPSFPDGYVSQAAVWGDFNGNGRLDLYVSGYENWSEGITWPDYLLINQGDGTFVIAATYSGRRARGVTTCDFDRSGALDIYVSNYRLQANQLWKNNGAASLTDVASARGVAAASAGFSGGHSIGAAWGDFNNSGWFDLFAGNFAHAGQPQSRFLRNRGPEGEFHFEDMGTGGVYYQESYASPAAGDFNNDGRLDLMFTTVYGTASGGVRNYPVLYQNEGGFRFSDVTAEAGLAELPPTYQAAWADFNNNGQLDLYVAGRLFENRGNSNHWLKVRLRGDGVNVNRSAIGAQVRIHIGEETLSRQVESGTGRGNQNDATLHFGLGSQPGPFDLDIFWPDGTTRTLSSVPSNRLINVTY